MRERRRSAPLSLYGRSLREEMMAASRIFHPTEKDLEEAWSAYERGVVGRPHQTAWKGGGVRAMSESSRQKWTYIAVTASLWFVYIKLFVLPTIKWEQAAEQQRLLRYHSWVDPVVYLLLGVAMTVYCFGALVIVILIIERLGR